MFEYTAFMPLRGVMHLKSKDNLAKVRFVSLELPSWQNQQGVPVQQTGTVVIVVKKLDEASAKAELARLHGCTPEDVKITVHRESTWANALGRK